MNQAINILLIPLTAINLSMKNLSALLNLSILCIMPFFTSCNYLSKSKSEGFKVIHNHKGKSIPEYVKHYSYQHDTATLDSITFYSLTGVRTKVHKYYSTSPDSIFFLEKNKIQHIYIPQEMTYLLYDNYGFVQNIINNNDSSVTVFYNRSNKIKKFYKFKCNYTYYRNTYDSLNGKLLECYRDINDSIRTINDSIEVSFSTIDIKENIENYSIIMIELDKRGLAKKTYFQKSKNPKFKFKEENKRFIKVICDSIGCYSLSYNIILEDQQ